MILQTVVGPQVLYNTKSVCPDSQCQIIVERNLAGIKKNFDDLAAQSAERKKKNAVKKII